MRKKDKAKTFGIGLILVVTCLFSFFDSLNAAQNRVEVFYSPACNHCREITDDFLPKMQAKYPGLFDVALVDINLPENQARLAEIEKIYGIQYRPPTMIIGGIILAGEEQVRAQFEAVLQQLRGVGFILKPSLRAEGEAISKNEIASVAFGNLAMTDKREPSSSATVLKEKFTTFSFLTIAAAGFLDGINPCAFTTIVFFISFLGFAGYQRRQISWIGTFFILAVFLTYLAIGFGLLRFLHTLAIFPIITKTLIWLVALLTLFLSFLSFRDFWIYRKTGQSRDLLLQLPLSIKQRIHRVIGEGFRAKDQGVHFHAERGTEVTPSHSHALRGNESSTKRPLLKLITTALVTGFLVSSFESVCTGQLYVPTLVYMTRLEEAAVKAWGYLLLYNGAFILPLVMVFLLSLFGMTSQQFAQWSSRHLGTVKIGTGIFFLILTVFLVTTNL